MMTIIRNTLFFILLVATVTQAQVVINPIVTNSPFFNLDQLTNIQLTNASVAPIQGIVQIQMEDNVHNSIFQMQSYPITINQGQRIGGQEIEWENGLQLGNEAVSRLLATSGELMSGQYVYCYRFLNSLTGQVVGSYCQENSFQNFQRPKLIFPAKQASLTNRFPVLIWQPPVPGASRGALNYTLRLVELEEGQAAVDALNRNMPLLERHHLKTSSLPYPITAMPLKEGQQYAWQVTAYWNDVEMGQTEIWGFEVVQAEKLPTENTLPSYRLVSKQMAGNYYVFDQQILFAYENKAREKNLRYKIYPKGEKENDFVVLPTISLSSGINQIAIDITNKLNLKKDSPYILEITDKHGFVYFLAFKVKK